MLLTASVILVIPIFWGLFEAYYDIYTTAGNQAETLTGRTAIWAYVLNAAFEQPWIGHGFDAMWKVVPPFGSDQFEARHAENELLQQFYAYGVAGIVHADRLIRQYLSADPQSPTGPLKLVFRSILFFVVIRGLAEAEPFDLLLPLWAIVMISLLVEQASGMDDDSTSASFSRQFDAPRPATSFNHGIRSSSHEERVNAVSTAGYSGICQKNLIYQYSVNRELICGKTELSIR